MSALTEEQKKEVLEMIKKENEEQKKIVAASSSSFEKWLKKKLPRLESVVRVAGLLVELYGLIKNLVP